MATDNLTLKFKEELEKRSKTQLPSVNRSMSPTGGTLWDELNREESGSAGLGDLGVLEPVKAIGAGVWSFADTWTFGAAGLLDDKLLGGILEDTMYDEESAWAKWGGAVGGLAGFVGNPMKLGFKAAGALAKPAAKMVGLGSKTQFMPDVAKRMTKVGLNKGLSKEQTQQVIRAYENLNQRAKYTADIANSWKKHSNKLLDEILEKGLGAGRLNAKEAAAVSQMFKGNAINRPVADLVDVVMKTGKFTNPKTAFVVGSMVNEAVAFGLIDSVFEVTRSIKEGESYDWTAPIWGIGVGAAFGTLKMLPSAGKASETFDWKKGDFTQGLKVLYGGEKTSFANRNLDELMQIAGGHGHMLKEYGERAFKSQAPFMKSFEKPWIVQVTYKGSKKGKRNMWLDMNNLEQYKNHKDIGKSALESMVREGLSKSTRNLGKEIIKGSLRDEAESMAANWHRMVAGSIIMNARTFLGMYQGMDPDVHDVLPHVLIGAWVNRRGNPASWDMNTQRMESIRGNLRFLGFDTPNLRSIPDFSPGIPSYINGMLSNPNLKPVLQELKDRQHITSDVWDVMGIRTKKEKGEKSVEMSDTNEARIYKAIWAYSTGAEKHQRPKDDIPMSDIKPIVEAFKAVAKKEGVEIKNEKDAFEYLEAMSDNTTESISSELVGVAREVSTITKEFSLSAKDTELKKQLS